MTQPVPMELKIRMNAESIVVVYVISNDYERETAKLRTEHRRQIEDLRDKLRTEKNLNKTAREAINRQINMLDTAFQRAQLQLIQKHNQDEEAANNERTQRRHLRALSLGAHAHA